MSAYGTDESRILGHLDVSTSEADWSSLIVCPHRYSNEIQAKHLIFSGSPNLSFTVQIDSSPRGIKLNEPQTVRVTPENVQIFQFFPPEDIAKTQLDVTVTSESADVPAYLKVSRVCEEVDKDDIDEVDYKGELLRLSFATKGRITLSKVSVPALTDSTSSWFIGIAIKNATGETPFNATKSVTLELNKSFDFSYGPPISLLVILSIVFGFVISLWAFRTFTEHCRCKPGEQHQTSSSNDSEVPGTSTNPTTSDQKTTKSQDTTLELSNQGQQSPPSSFNEESAERTPTTADQNKTKSQGTGIEPLDQEEQSEPSQSSKEELNEKTPLISKTSNTTVNIKQSPSMNKTTCWHAFSNWYERGPKTYSFTAAIVGFMLMIGAGQFVFANWHLMKDEGDRDNCYYNDFCYRVSPWHDIPFNLMISNIVYIIHGLILATFICCWERKERRTKTNVSAPAEQVFSIGYAFAWAMIFEGLFSLVYHLCPSKLTFQFDTAFMFVIAGLIIISLYNGTAKNPVEAEHFFLYFLVPLFIFNYLGAVRHSEIGLPTPLQILFFIALAVWFVSICSWALLKLHFTPGRF